MPKYLAHNSLFRAQITTFALYFAKEMSLLSLWEVNFAIAQIFRCRECNASVALLVHRAVEVINRALVLHHARLVCILCIKLLRRLNEWLTLPVCPVHKVIRAGE